MTQRKRNTRKKATSNAQVNALVKSVKQLSVKPKKSKPFRETGGVIGNRIGGMFGNASIGRGVGRWLGTGIGSIFGSGDYQMIGGSPAYNVLTNGAQIPKFSSSRQTNIVCHREYLKDFSGTSGFNLTSFSLNPGLADTFPWLSSIASSYQEYKFHGLVFEFRSLITDFVTSGAPGVVIMATNYNADATPYTSKQQMENSEFAVATKPTINLMHGVECADNQTILPQRYVRSGSVPAGQDLRLYDHGTFQFATASNPSQTLGELWVSYCVEFFKPVLPLSGALPGIGFQTTRTGYTNALPLGNVVFSSNGGLSVTVTGTTLIVRNAEVGVRYKADFMWFGGAAAAFGAPAISFTNGVAVNLFNGNTTNYAIFPAAAAVSATGESNLTFTSTLVSPGDITVTLGPALLPTGGGAVQVFVTQLDPTIL